MSKSKRKINKTKSLLKLSLKDFSLHSLLSLLSQNVKNINVAEFEVINTVNMTEKISVKNLFKFLIH